MAAACKQKDCTIAQTNVCLLNNDPDTCPQRAGDVQTDISSEIEDLPPPPKNPSFPASLTLSLADAGKLMARSYCHLIGVLGVPDAGKTAVLVCTYLLLAQAKLAGFEFRNSLSIMALEEISRGARRWKQDQSPGKLTAHTESPDERAAGFIHLKLAQTKTATSLNVLVSDLPGEWSNDLIDFNKIDRLDFLKAADVIWIMVDGVELTNPATRQVVLHRTAVLLQRVHELISRQAFPVYLVISRRDKGLVPADACATLIAEGSQLGMSTKVIQIASFSEDDGVEPGMGIPELIATPFEQLPTRVRFWAERAPTPGAREILRFRSHREKGG